MFKYIIRLSYLIIISLLILTSCTKKTPKIAWETDYSFAEILVSSNGKNVMIDFVRDGCSACVRLDAETFSNEDVIEFVNTNLKAVKMHADSAEGKMLIERYKIFGYPTIVFTDSVGTEIDRIVGYRPPDEFLSELNRIQKGENTIPDLVKKTTLAPDNIDLWTQLASKYEDRGDLNSAVEVWESVAEAEIGEQDFTAYKLIELYANINNDVEGLETYISENLDGVYAPYAFKNILKILRRKKDVSSETDAWRRHINLMELRNETTAEIYNSYAWRMTELEQNMETALKKIRKGIGMVAEDDSPKLAALKDTEAELLWKLGMVDEAVKIIDECIDLQPDDKYFKEQKEKFLAN